MHLVGDDIRASWTENTMPWRRSCRVPKDRADASITSARPLESRPWRARGGLVGGGPGGTGDRRFLGAHGAHCVS